MVNITVSLVLLDYVNRPHVHEIEIRPSSVRPCGIDYLYTYCMNFFPLVVVASPGAWATCPDVLWFFFFFEKQNKTLMFQFFTIFFASINMGPMGAKNSKRYSFKSMFNLFFWIFFSFVTKILFGIFEMLTLRFFTFFFVSLAWDPKILSFRFLTISFLIHHCTLWETKNLDYLENERQGAKRNKIWAYGVSVQYIS